MILFNKLKLPDEITNIENALIHITDTPNSTFSYLKKVLKALKPKVIVHTGDLVDNYKLERSARYMMFYVKDLNKLDLILASGKPEEIWITLGNHDEGDSVKTCISKAEQSSDSFLKTINGRTFAMAHYFEKIQEIDADFKMFGHSMETVSDIENGILNGLEHIHIIDLDTGKVHLLKYPYGTDNERMRLFKGGL